MGKSVRCASLRMCVPFLEPMWKALSSDFHTNTIGTCAYTHDINTHKAKIENGAHLKAVSELPREIAKKIKEGKS